MLHKISMTRLGLDAKNCFRGFANKKAADQSVQPLRLIAALVTLLLESILSRLATSEKLVLLLVSVAKQVDLNINLSDTTKTGFLATQPISFQMFQENPVTPDILPYDLSDLQCDLT